MDPMGMNDASVVKIHEDCCRSEVQTCPGTSRVASIRRGSRWNHQLWRQHLTAPWPWQVMASAAQELATAVAVSTSAPQFLPLHSVHKNFTWEILSCTCDMELHGEMTWAPQTMNGHEWNDKSPRLSSTAGFFSVGDTCLQVSKHFQSEGPQFGLKYSSATAWAQQHAAPVHPNVRQWVDLSDLSLLKWNEKNQTFASTDHQPLECKTM